MIKLETLTKSLQDGLNNNPYNFEFVIASDMDKLNRDIGNLTASKRIVNGILHVTSSDIIPAQGLSIAMQSAKLELVTEVNINFKDIAMEIITNLRNLLDDYFAKYTTQILEDENGSLYSVTTMYSLANTGTFGMREGIGGSVTFEININYSFIENGLSSLNCTAKLNGVQLPFTTANIVRTPIVENNPYSDILGVAKNVSTATTFGIDFKLPAVKTLNNAASSAIINFILNGDTSVTHDLELNINGDIKKYRVTIGECSMTIDGVQNAGHSVSFVEARE